MFKRNSMKAMLKEVNKTDFTCGCTNNLDDFKVSYTTNGKNIDKIEVECHSTFNGNNMRVDFTITPLFDKDYVLEYNSYYYEKDRFTGDLKSFESDKIPHYNTPCKVVTSLMKSIIDDRTCEMVGELVGLMEDEEENN